MEFKGTKGKWGVKNGQICSSVYCGEEQIALKGRSNLEARANMLLISKAPELLDLLNRISGEILRSDFVLDEKWYDKIQKLINEATNV